MPTIERRVTELEKARGAFVGPLLLFVEGQPTPEQRQCIEEAKAAGRHVVLVRWLDAEL